MLRLLALLTYPFSSLSIQNPPPQHQTTLDEVAARHFPGEASSAGEALARPILFSTWLSRQYRPVKREELRDFVAARLKVCMYACVW